MSNIMYPVAAPVTAYPADLNQLVYADNGTADVGDITAFAQITTLPGALTAAAGTTGSLSGAYAYQVTFVTGLVDGTGALHIHGETTGGTTSTTVNVTSQNINLSAIPVGPTGTIARKIYRTVAGGSSFLFDFQISDNTTTSWTDTTADSGLGAAIPTTNTTGSRFVGNGSGLVNIPVSAMSLPSLVSTLDLAVDVKRDYNASGSGQSTTGNISVGSAVLTLASALDFKNGQGISITNAGPLPAISAPTSLTVTPTGTAGTTSYTYAVAALDGKGGATAVFSASTTTGNATLSSTNYNALTVGAVTSATGYAWYRTSSGGTPSTTGFIGTTAGLTLNDTGLTIETTPPGIPTSAPISALGDSLTTNISSGAGTTTLTLAANASTTVAGSSVNHDDTVAIQNAINAINTIGGGIVFFPSGTYLASNLLGANQVSLIGENRNICTIKAIFGITSDFVQYYDTCNNFVIDNLTFDFNNYNTGSQAAIGIRLADNFIIRNCQILNLYNYGLALNAVTNFNVCDNIITRATPSGSIYNVGLVVEMASGQSLDGEIIRNTFNNTAMDLSGQRIKVNFNHIQNFMCGAGIVTEQDGNSHNYTIMGNIIHGGTGTDLNGYNCGGIENWGPRSVIIGNEIFNNSGSGIDQGGQASIISGNLIHSNGTTGGSGITNRYATSSYNGSDSVICGNKIFDLNGTSGTQQYGIADQGSSTTNITISGNSLENNRLGDQNILGSRYTIYNPSIENDAVAWTVPSLATGTATGTDITVGGVTLGDYILVSCNSDLQGLTLTGYVKVGNDVHLQIVNNTGATINLGAVTFNIKALKPINYIVY